MNQGPDEKMEDIMEESPYEMGYGPEGEDSGHDRPYGDPPGQKKFLLLGGAGILLLIIFVILFFGTGDRPNTEDLIAINARLNRVAERLTQLEEIENRIALLQKQERELRQSISRLESSGKSFKAQLDKLAQKFGRPQKGMASRTAKAKTSSAIKKKAPSGTKGRYYVVRRGDSLYRVAKKYNLSIKELCRLNKISPKQAIRPGQRLLIASGAR